MGSAVFTYAPDYQAQAQYKPRVRVAAFGDGYEQRVPFGINTNPQTWTLKFENRDNTEGTAIQSFLNARGGYDSFVWTPPGQSVSLKFVCREWVAMPVKGTGSALDGSLQTFWTINATFVQVFES